ncbi:hypothetical protein AAK967_00305 [Atopobiaceae bacterium 24-176]
MGSERPSLGAGSGHRTGRNRHATRRRSSGQPPQLHGRGYQTPGQRRRNAGGYQLQRHPINFGGRRGRLGSVDPRLIVLAAAALLAVVLIVFSVVSCVSSTAPSKDQGPTVSQELPSDLQNSLKQALSRNAQLADIAERGTEYPESLIRLALSEPASVGFVYGWTSSDHETAQAYDDAVAKGTVPELYGWDARWGYLDYGGSPLAVSGSGPIACAIARMGLLGNAEQTPTTIAKAAADAGKASGDSGTDSTFFTEKAADLGLAMAALDLQGASGGAASSSGQGDNAAEAGDSGTGDAGQAQPGEALAKALGGSAYVLVETNGGALGSASHWVLVTAGDNGAVTVHDPMSTANSSHQWDPATVAADAKSVLTVQPAKA